MRQTIIPLPEIQKKLREFKLSGIINTLELRLKQAEDDNLGYTEFLSLLLEDEVNRRSDNRKGRLYRRAKLPFEKGIEDFDFAFQPSIKKQEIFELATCRFLEKRQNLIFIGAPGTGKTHLSVALALEVLGRGKTVLFTTVWEMINSLQQSRADYSYQRKIQLYLKPDLLILDELGYRSMAESTVEDFFEIVSKRYEKGSIIITSNRSIHQWDRVFIDKTLTTAIIDRLLHHCSVIEIKGESYRFKKRD
jgi:DNA replication protein DnaC